MERMERKKRSGNVVKSNGNPLSALDAFIKEQAVAMQPIQPGEFSLNDYIERMKDQGVNLGVCKASRMLDDLFNSGAITSRKGVQNGKQRNFYRFV
jgi:predicted peroxiredoxin